MASLANSDGWMLKPNAWIQSLAPLTVVPEHDGDHQQREADGADEVAVAVELHVVAHDEHGEDEEAGADQQPLPLGERERGLDAEDLGEADGRQQRGDRAAGTGRPGAGRSAPARAATGRCRRRSGRRRWRRC